MAQILDVDFFLDGCGMVISSFANCCMDSFPVLVIAQYSLKLIYWSEFGASRGWRQRMIHLDFVQVKIVFLQNVKVDDGCGVL